jgi:hypothetical protein
VVRYLAIALVALGALAGSLVVTGCGGGGGSGSSVVKGTDGDDQLTGDEGDDEFAAGAGKDVVEGKGGNDTIDGGEDADFLYGGDGDDKFGDNEDDAVDVIDCGPGKDSITKPDARDELLPSCEDAGWTSKPLSEQVYENTITVAPDLGPGSAVFTATCPQKACDGDLELRTPHDRRLLGKGTFTLAKGQASPVSVTLNKRGDELVKRSGYVRVVIRANGVNSGFTTFFRK